MHKAFGLKNPIMTDSGGFQIFSLGWGKVHKIGKVANNNVQRGRSDVAGRTQNPVKISKNGVVFVYDGKNTNLTRTFP